jgi:hypothetical protein
VRLRPQGGSERQREGNQEASKPDVHRRPQTGGQATRT